MLSLHNCTAVTLPTKWTCTFHSIRPTLWCSAPVLVSTRCAMYICCWYIIWNFCLNYFTHSSSWICSALAPTPSPLQLRVALQHLHFYKSWAAVLWLLKELNCSTLTSPQSCSTLTSPQSCSTLTSEGAELQYFDLWRSWTAVLWPLKELNCSTLTYAKNCSSKREVLQKPL